MQYPIYSSCPVVRDEEMNLFEEVTVDGMRRFFPIRKRILWVRKSDTQVVLAYGGVLVDEKETFNDHYGFLSSLKNAIGRDAVGWAKKFGIVQGDKFAVELNVTVEDVPYQADPTWVKREGYKRQFFELPQTESGYRGKWLVSDKPNEWGVGMSLKAVPVAEVKGIYSTTRHPIGEMPPDVAAWITEQNKAAGVVEHAA